MCKPFDARNLQVETTSGEIATFICGWTTQLMPRALLSLLNFWYVGSWEAVRGI